MKQMQERTPFSRRVQDGTFLSPEELAPLLPLGWPTGIPLVRIGTCGLLTIEVLREVRHDPDGRLVLVYEAPDDHLMQRKGSKTALNLLKLLVSQSGRFATKDWLLEKLHRSRGDKEEWGGLARFDNVVSLLRGILCLQGMPGEDYLRKILVECISSTPESGTSYRLASFPLIWLDVEEMAIHVRQAQECEASGQNAFPSWQAAYDIGKHGPFLADALYSDWATGKRGEIEGCLWQSVQALSRIYVARQDASGEEKALRLLQEYWLWHVENEQAFLLFLPLLGQRSEYRLAEKYYEMLCEELEKDGRAPAPRTIDAVTLLRTQESRDERGSYRIVFRSRDRDELSLQEAKGGSTHDGHSLPPLSHLATLSESSLPRFWNVPYQRNPLFTGREDVLTRLHEMLASKQTTVAVTQHALCGLGGIGKTQTVLEYIYRYGSEYQVVIWIKADTRENLLADFLSIVQILALPERDAQDQAVVIAAIQRWLREHTRWLLIFDNADDIEIVQEVLPTGYQGHVLLTTRAQAIGRMARRLEIEEMSQEIGALFLLRRAGLIGPDALLEKALEKDRVLAQELVQALGGLPLALDQAGAYIEKASLSIEEYSQLYRQERYALLARRGGLVADHPEPVSATWSLCFTRIEQMDQGAADILRFCAFLNPDAIPEEIFLHGAASVCPSLSYLQKNPLKFHQAVEILRKFSLVRRNADTKILTIHRLVQVCVQFMMDEQMKSDWAKWIIQALSATFPTEVVVEQWPLCQRLLPHVQEGVALVNTYSLIMPEVGLLFNQAAYYLRERAMYAEAESFYQQALAIRERIFGISHSDTAQILYNLARLHFDLGQYTTCEQLHLQALDIREQVLPQDHLGIALSLNSLAFLYYLWGVRFEDAEKLFQRALLLFSQTIGIDHPKTSHCLSNLALLYASQGKYAEAEQLLLQVKALREKHLGPLHLDTARVLQNLAWLYSDQGNPDRYAEADLLFEQALKIREKLLGSDHPQTAISLHHLALFEEAQEHYEEADRLYQRVLAIRRVVMGPDNPRVLWTEEAYAKLLRKMGESEQAILLEAHIQEFSNNATIFTPIGHKYNGIYSIQNL